MNKRPAKFIDITRHARPLDASRSNARNLRVITFASIGDGQSTFIERLRLGGKAFFAELAFTLAPRVHPESAHKDEEIADTPTGDVFYTRNIAAGASKADLAIVLIDAQKGVLTATRRHTRIAAMMGIRHVLLAINKMDQVAFSQQIFNSLEAEYHRFAADLQFQDIQAIPLCASSGDNMLQPSEQMSWYSGPSLMQHLDEVDTRHIHDYSPLRMPVQTVNRANLGTIELIGFVTAGQIKAGDAVKILPSGVQTYVKEIIAESDSIAQASVGDAITLTLVGDVDVHPGDVIAAADQPPEVADQFEAKLLWMSEYAMTPSRQYLMKLATKETTATITTIKYREDILTSAHLAAKTLDLNDIATVNLSTNTPLVFEPFSVNPSLGSFTLIDKLTLETVGVGTIDFALRRANNIHWQALELTKHHRAAQKHQVPKCIWFTGLSGSGKSTIANLLEKRLHADGKHTYLLDGDNVRHGLNRDLGFTEADRVENIRRVIEVAKLMVDAGLIVLVSFISPFRAERLMARNAFPEGEFVEVFVDTPLEACEQRDVKGLYAKARKGELKNFTGIDSPYETPESAEVHLHTMHTSVQACVQQIYTFTTTSSA